MSSDRRSFLVGAPAALLGLADLAELSWAQSGGAQPTAAGVADFWSRRMGVPARALIRGASRSAATPPPSRDPELLSSPLSPRPGAGAVELGSAQPIIEATPVSAGLSGFGREPLFFYLDEDEQALVPAVEVPTRKLHPSGDTMVDLQMNRLRLSPADASQFGRFASGGIYLDMQQQHPQPANTQAATALASSLLSAIFPAAGAATKPKNSASAPSPSASAPAPAGIPLQQTAQAQSIGLPNGIGKLAFSCFMKDRRKSAFGTLVSAFLEMGSSPSRLTYLPMLSLPVVAAPALVAIRTLVGNLQLQGADHQWIMGSGPVDVSCTAEGCSNLPSGLRLRTGTYIAIPREQSDLVRNKLSGLKTQDGFLVPKQAGYLDTFDAVPQTLPGVTYLSIALRVKPTKLTNCSFPLPAA